MKNQNKPTCRDYFWVWSFIARNEWWRIILNTKDPSLKKDETATTGNRLAENDNPETSSHDTSEDLNAGELAAFQKIMGDIDGQEEEESNGTPEETGTGEKVQQALTEAV